MNTVSRMLFVAGAVALSGAPRAWGANQAAPTEKAAAQAAPRENARIKLSHIAPSRMAWMIAPGDFPEPEVFYTREEMEAVLRPGTPQAQIDAILNKGKRNLTPTPRKAGGLFALPEGVESIAPIDIQSALLVHGTPEGIERMRQIVKALDVPLRKVELDVLSVRINKAALKELGVDWTQPEGTPSLGFVRRPGFKEAVKRLLDANLATTILEARTVMTNNIGGSLSSLAFGDRPPILSTVELQLTPTINGDNTITIAMQSTTKVPRSITPAPNPGVQSVANIRDGDTLAITASDVDQTSQQLTVSFVTARIVRRADEKK